MLLYFIRHGDPIYNPDQLTPLGRRQAEAIARRLSVYGVDKIYSSTSPRAYQTALPTSEILKKEITQLDFCNEAHAWNELCVIKENGFQTWLFQDPETMQLLASKEVRALGEKWYEHPQIAHYHFEKGLERIQKHTDELLLSLGYEHLREKNLYRPVRPNDDRVALFAHEGFGAAFLSSVLDIPYPDFSIHYGVSHSTLTVIEFRVRNDYVIPTLITMGNDAHLFHESLMAGYQNRVRY